MSEINYNYPYHLSMAQQLRMNDASKELDGHSDALHQMLFSHKFHSYKPTGDLQRLAAKRLTKSGRAADLARYIADGN